MLEAAQRCSGWMLTMITTTDQKNQYKIRGRIPSDESNISAICPGVERLLNQNSTQPTFLQVNVSDCENNLPQFTAHHGLVYGVCEDASSFCKLHFQVPHGSIVLAHVERLAYGCSSWHWKMRMTDGAGVYDIESRIHSIKDVFVESCKNAMLVTNINNPQINISIQAVQNHSYVINSLQEYSGVVILPVLLFRPSAVYRTTLVVPTTCVVLISIQQALGNKDISKMFMTFAYRKSKTQHQSQEKVLIDSSLPVFVLAAAQVQIYVHHPTHRGSYCRLYFSSVSLHHQPQRLPSSLYNCSVDHYSTFQDHMHCNLKPECEDGRDETEHCPFSGPGCQGLVASRNKCFLLVELDVDLLYKMFSYQCKVRGGRLASIKTCQEKDDLTRIFINNILFKANIGGWSGSRFLPFTYSKFPVWSDHTLIYGIDHFHSEDKYCPSRVYRSMNLASMELRLYTFDLSLHSAVCELPSLSPSIIPLPVSLAHSPAPPPTYKVTSHLLWICPDSHLTHLFLLCDPLGYCRRGMLPQDDTIPSVNDEHNVTVFSAGRFMCTDTMFRCDDGITTVHYTLLCDFRQHCPDESDESFCVHPSRDGFGCVNGQSVLDSQHCNEHSDCVDSSDEASCPVNTTMHYPTSYGRKEESLYINLDGTGYFTQQVMGADAACPDSHYRCISQWLHCLPVYTRCNGFSDCVYGEDEHACEISNCPGFYHCRASRVCVHRDHLCDGWGQCPQQDDEVMCDRTCPEHCLCQGHLFVCRKPFAASLFPDLRSLDAQGSGMVMHDVVHNGYLIRLSMASCSLFNISVIYLINLQFIDISNNPIRFLNIAVFLVLPNLRTLYMENNPLVKMTNSLLKYVQFSLQRVDISETCVSVYRNSLSVYLPSMEYLNISFSAIEGIGSMDFRNAPRLTELDMRGNPVNAFPQDIFSGAPLLKYILSSNYRLCCRSIFPQESSPIKCVAPQPVFQSCEMLIPTQVNRVFIWLVGTFAIMGHLLCFLVSLRVRNLFGSRFSVNVFHLQLGNLCMGCHVCITAIADTVLHGDYIQLEKEWTSSVTCKVSGFLCLVYSKVSVIITLLISVDHVIILCHPSESRTASKRSATITCCVAWCVGIVLSVIPFLPGLSHWGLRGQSGLCRLALFHCHHCNQGFKWFTVVLVINFILTSVSTSLLVVIFRRTPEYRIALSSAQRSVYSSVHFTGKIIITNAFCWLPFGPIWMTDSAGITGLNMIRDLMVVYVLPLNSALHPCLYQWTVVTHIRRQERENRLLKVFRSQTSLSNSKVLNKEK